ncbi:MAG TPA: UbiA family prenyltransferase [Anaerolineales bacterium]|nr:UbiA family prenyltransferase [Anaerolineales bacterium]
MVEQTQTRTSIHLRDVLRLIRVEDYSTFIQLVIGFVLAGGQDWMYLMGALAILAPCVYGGLYALNDVHDASADRLHPIKCTRPVASGRIDPGSASLLGTALISFGVGTALVHDFKVFVLALLFVAINLAYTFRFKTVPYIEILLNTVTHPLRFAAGLWLAGSWEHLPLLAAWVLSVFAITTLKRIKEMRESGAAVRPVLRHYNQPTLKRLIVASLVTMLGIWPFTYHLDFLLTGIWLALTLVAVVGYFRSPFLRQLEEYLWR